MDLSTLDQQLFDLSGVTFAVQGRVILKPLSLRLEPGRIHGLVGQNGSGKSTLLKILARQVRPTGGELRFGARPLQDWADRDYARQVAYMPQFTPPADGMTVRELVALGRFPWHGTLGRFSDEDGRMVEAAIDQVGLKDFADRAVDTMSGGERQRAWLALMLAQNARCLLLDEPTSALDIAHQAEVLALVQTLARERGMAVVVILHDINLAARYCDEIVALRDGRMVVRGPAAALMQPQVLDDIYGVRMGIFTHPVTGWPVSYLL
jgi:iron complex transport system ATP-binding protein